MDNKADIIHVPIEKLKPHPKNSKLHPENQIKKIAASIHDYGFNNPILIDSSFTIIAGHGRVQAAKFLKMKSVPGIIVDHMSENQKRAYLIADNKVSESAYDMEILTDELFELSLEGIDMVDLGFDPDEMEKIAGVAAQIDEENEGDNETQVETGQVWKCGRHTVVVGKHKIRLTDIADRMIKESETTFYLPERQAIAIISHFDKQGWDIKKEDTL